MHYLVSCSIVKDEDKYIDEFVQIHKFLGIEHFLFFDRSKNPLSEKFKGRNDITVIHFPEPQRHAHAWLEGTKFWAGKTKWVQYIDIDQVLVPKHTLDLRELMSNYEAYEAVGFNWHSFGANSNEIEPEGLSTYEAYTRRARGNEGINNHIQTVAQPGKLNLAVWPDPHHPPLPKGIFQFNEHKRAIPYNSPFNSPATQDIAFIAHYYTRSRQYWQHKINKLRADTGTSAGSMADFDHHQAYMNAEEDFIVRNIWNKAKNV